MPKAPAGAQTCRVCGCWELDPCFDEDKGECYWVESDLCSHCADKPEAAVVTAGGPGFRMDKANRRDGAR